MIVSKNNLTLLERDGVCAILNQKTLEFFSKRINKNLKERDLLKLLENDFKRSSDVTINKGPRLIPPAFHPLLYPTQKSHLDRLTLNISNSCNLWCSYCYADHGNYHSPSSLMDAGKALDVVARCIEFYRSIRTIQFFGGEPLLNTKAIEAVCLFFSKISKNNPPRFVATTNGTIFNKDVERLIRQFNIALTISLDGPKIIHDKLRPTRDKKSSYEQIMDNLYNIRELGTPIDFESTYTNLHYEMGITVSDLLDFFWEELEKRDPHISWTYLPMTDKPKSGVIANGIFRKDFEYQTQQNLNINLIADLFRDATRKSILNIKNKKGAALSFVFRVIDHLVSQEMVLDYCPAFHSQLSIATNGDVFPCFMFIGDPEMCLGNIFDDKFPKEETKINEIWKRFTGEFGSEPTGTKKWYAPLLTGCIAGEYIASGTFSDRAYEIVQTAIIEETLLGIAEIESCSSIELNINQP